MKYGDKIRWRDKKGTFIAYDSLGDCKIKIDGQIIGHVLKSEVSK